MAAVTVTLSSRPFPNMSNPSRVEFAGRDQIERVHCPRAVSDGAKDVNWDEIGLVPLKPKCTVAQSRKRDRVARSGRGC
jgi:hypothetical protein